MQIQCEDNIGVNSGGNTLSPEQKGWHFVDDIFKYIFSDLTFTFGLSQSQQWFG